MKGRGGLRGVACVTHVSPVHPMGDTRILYKEASALAAEGYDVAVAAAEEPIDLCEDVRAVELRLPTKRFLRVVISPWIALCAALRVRADVYHLHDPEILWIGPLLKLVTGAKILFDVHENVVAQIKTKHWISRWLRRPLGCLYRSLERVLLPVYDSVILAEDSYAPLYRWHPRAVVIHNYPITSCACAPYTHDEGGLRLVYVGRMDGSRGALTMLEAAVALKHRGVEVTWHLAGLAAPELDGEMREFIISRGLERNVFLAGRLSFPEAMRLVACADLGISVLSPLPNYVESMPTKLLEYLAAGIPVIASDFALWRSLLERFECGIAIPADDSEALAAAVEKLASAPGLRKRMGEAGRKRLLESGMTWEAESQKLLHLYEGILGE